MISSLKYLYGEDRVQQLSLRASHKCNSFLRISWYPTYSSCYCLILHTPILDEAMNKGDLMEGNYKVRMKPLPFMHNWSPIGIDWLIDSQNASSLQLTVLYPILKYREYTTQRRKVAFKFCFLQDWFLRPRKQWFKIIPGFAFF